MDVRRRNEWMPEVNSIVALGPRSGARRRAPATLYVSRGFSVHQICGSDLVQVGSFKTFNTRLNAIVRSIDQLAYVSVATSLMSFRAREIINPAPETAIDNNLRDMVLPRCGMISARPG